MDSHPSGGDRKEARHEDQRSVYCRRRGCFWRCWRLYRGSELQPPANARRSQLIAAPITPQAPGTAGSLGDQSWEQVFPEPELQGLIRTALAEQLTISASPRNTCWSSRRRCRSFAPQELPTAQRRGHRRRSRPAVVAGEFHREPAGVRCLQPFGFVGARFLGTLPAADGGGQGAASGANLGAARRSPVARRRRWPPAISLSARSIASLPSHGIL